VYARPKEPRHRRDGQPLAIDDVATHQPGDDEGEIALPERDERGLDIRAESAPPRTIVIALQRA
jgi:hypothetical protein